MGFCTAGNQVVTHVWEFNPDRERPRNGLAPLLWRDRGEIPPEILSRYPRTATLPDGRIRVADNTRAALYDPKTENWKMLAGISADYGVGNTVYDNKRNVVWETAASFLKFQPLSGASTKVASYPRGLSRGAGIAIVQSGMIFLWGGAGTVVRYDADAGDWTKHDFAKGPDGRGDVYTKWIYLQKDRVFLGYSSPRTGVWVFQPPLAGWDGVDSASAR